MDIPFKFWNNDSKCDLVAPKYSPMLKKRDTMAIVTIP